MQLFKGILIGIVGTFVLSFCYTTYVHTSFSTIDFLAASFYKILPDIYRITIFCGASVFIIWFYRWWKNNAAEIAEEEINRARDNAEEIKYDAHLRAAEFRKDTDKLCLRLRMEAEALHAAAKEEHDAIIRKKCALEQHYAELVTDLENNFVAKKSAYTIEIEALVKKNKKLHSGYHQMVSLYNGALAENGLATVANKYHKRAKKLLTETDYHTPGITSIFAGNEPPVGPSVV